MTTKHTPGPWKCGKDEAFVYALNAHGSNRFFAGVQAGWLAGEPVEGRTEPAELLANAKLMSAAPDLLAVAEAHLTMLWDEWHAHMSQDEFDRHPEVIDTRAAIKKARGD
jgi:hypothetical protein